MLLTGFARRNSDETVSIRVVVALAVYLASVPLGVSTKQTTGMGQLRRNLCLAWLPYRSTRNSQVGQAMSTHEYQGDRPSRAGRKLAKLGPGIITAKRLAEALAEGEAMKRDVALFREAASGTWGVSLDGEDVIRGESYEVAAAVEQSLREGATGDTEADEVARGILSRKLLRDVLRGRGSGRG